MSVVEVYDENKRSRSIESSTDNRDIEAPPLISSSSLCAGTKHTIGTVTDALPVMSHAATSTNNAAFDYPRWFGGSDDDMPGIDSSVDGASDNSEEHARWRSDVQDDSEDAYRAVVAAERDDDTLTRSTEEQYTFGSRSSSREADDEEEECAVQQAVHHSGGAAVLGVVVKEGPAPVAAAIDTPQLQHISVASSGVGVEPEQLTDANGMLWRPLQSEPQLSLRNLGDEIKQFVDTHLSLSPSEVADRNRFISQLSTLLTETISPSCKLKVHGSFITNLALRESDIDFLVTDYAPMQPIAAIDKMTLALLQYTTDETPTKAPPPSDVSVLNRASGPSPGTYVPTHEGDVFTVQAIVFTRVPIIKITERRTGIKGDMSFGGGHHDESMRLTRKLLTRFPTARPLLLFLKNIIKDGQMGESAKGGLSSFALYLLVMHFYNIRFHSDGRMWEPTRPSDNASAAEVGSSYSAATPNSLASPSTGFGTSPSAVTSALDGTRLAKVGSKIEEFLTGEPKSTTSATSDKKEKEDESASHKRRQSSTLSFSRATPIPHSIGAEDDGSPTYVEENDPRTLGEVFCLFCWYYSEFEIQAKGIVFDEDGNSYVVPKPENLRGKATLHMTSPFDPSYDITARMTCIQAFQQLLFLVTVIITAGAKEQSLSLASLHEQIRECFVDYPEPFDDTAYRIYSKSSMLLAGPYAARGRGGGGSRSHGGGSHASNSNSNKGHSSMMITNNSSINNSTGAGSLGHAVAGGGGLQAHAGHHHSGHHHSGHHAMPHYTYFHAQGGYAAHHHHHHNFQPIHATFGTHHQSSQQHHSGLLHSQHVLSPVGTVPVGGGGGAGGHPFYRDPSAGLPLSDASSSSINNNNSNNPSTTNATNTTAGSTAHTLHGGNGTSSSLGTAATGAGTVGKGMRGGSNTPTTKPLSHHQLLSRGGEGGVSSSGGAGGATPTGHQQVVNGFGQQLHGAFPDAAGLTSAIGCVTSSPSPSSSSGVAMGSRMADAATSTGNQVVPRTNTVTTQTTSSHVHHHGGGLAGPHPHAQYLQGLGFEGPPSAAAAGGMFAPNPNLFQYGSFNPQHAAVGPYHSPYYHHAAAGYSTFMNHHHHYHQQQQQQQQQQQGGVGSSGLAPNGLNQVSGGSIPIAQGGASSSSAAYGSSSKMKRGHVGKFDPSSQQQQHPPSPSPSPMTLTSLDHTFQTPALGSSSLNTSQPSSSSQQQQQQSFPYAQQQQQGTGAVAGMGMGAPSGGVGMGPAGLGISGRGRGGMPRVPSTSSTIGGGGGGNSGGAAASNLKLSPSLNPVGMASGSGGGLSTSVSTPHQQQQHNGSFYNNTSGPSAQSQSASAVQTTASASSSSAAVHYSSLAAQPHAVAPTRVSRSSQQHLGTAAGKKAGAAAASSSVDSGATTLQHQTVAEGGPASFSTVDTSVEPSTSAVATAAAPAVARYVPPCRKAKLRAAGGGVGGETTPSGQSTSE